MDNTQSELPTENSNVVSSPTSSLSSKSRKLYTKPVILILTITLLILSATMAKLFLFSEQKSSISQVTLQTPNVNQNLFLVYGTVSPSEEMYFRISMDGQTKTEIPIQNQEIDNIYDELKASKDGKYLAHRTTKNVEIASVDQPSVFNNIVAVSEENRVIGSLVWSSDGTKLAYTVTNKPGYPPFVPPTLYIVDRAGSNVKTVDTHGAIYIGQLIGFNSSTNEVYAMAQVLLPVPKNAVLVSINLLDGNYKQIVDDETGLTLDAPIISPDFTKAYNIINMNQLIEYSLSNKTSKVLYVPKASNSIPQDKIKLWALQISPRGDKLIFLQFADVHPEEKEKQKERGNDLYLFDLQNEKSSILLDKSTYEDLGHATWSPDGNYLLINISTSFTDLLFNMTTKKVADVHKSTENRMNFLTWIVE